MTEFNCSYREKLNKEFQKAQGDTESTKGGTDWNSKKEPNNWIEICILESMEREQGERITELALTQVEENHIFKNIWAGSTTKSIDIGLLDPSLEGKWNRGKGLNVCRLNKMTGEQEERGWCGSKYQLTVTMQQESRDWDKKQKIQGEKNPWKPPNL